MHCRYGIRRICDSRASEFSSRSDLGHLVIILIRRCVRQILLRRRGWRVRLRARGASIYIVWMLSGSGVLIVPPLLVGLVWWSAVVSTVATILIVRCIVVRAIVSSIGLAAIPLVELVTVHFLFL
jgi:hypothetical protein